MRIFIPFFLVFFSHADASPLRRPFTEYEKVKYVVMSADFDYRALPIKKRIIKLLPDDVEVVVYAESQKQSEAFLKAIKSLERKNIRFLVLGGEGTTTLWTRDSWPYPVIENNRLKLIGASYHGGFEPDFVVADYFNVELENHGRYFEHGDLSANRLGECFVVQDFLVESLSDELFENYYGCKELIRLPFVHGIGHADEVIKFVSDNTVLVNQPEWISFLEERGYRTFLLPEAELPSALAERGVLSQRSYVNSLLVNGMAFVPVFGLKTDFEALNVYRSLGFKVFPIESRYISDKGGGALHCLTMTYPDGQLSLDSSQ